MARKSVRPKFFADINELTPRERDVVIEVAKGQSNQEIASVLGISVETVKEHMQNVMRKTKFNNRVKVAVWWALNGE